MMHDKLAAWALTLMMHAAPPGMVPARESAEDGEARYREIAEVVVSTVEKNDSLFPGQHGREKTIALLLAVGYFESGFRKDVDDGSTRGKLGECGLWQVMPLEPGNCVTWTKDRSRGAAMAMKLMRHSQRACLKPGVPFDHFLAAYASGSCTAGLNESEVRIGMASRWYRNYPPPPHEVAAR